jgi:UDP-glucuronate 4-epimerase
MKILVTGVAGFIGFHTAMRLLSRGDSVVGVDCVNNYYDQNLKESRLKIIENYSNEINPAWSFWRENLCDRSVLEQIFKEHKVDRVIHLAAQAGVRHSLENPYDYVENNIVAFLNILQSCRNNAVQHLTYASTSSVYGANTKMPFSEHAGVDHPLQFYAATKRANELMAHSYSHLFRLPTTGLRFFTVYGPWGRPDMALFKFTKNILEGKAIQVFNYGEHTRDFTYVDDIVEGVVRVNDMIATPNPLWHADNPDPATSDAPFRIFNIGNNKPVKLVDYIRAIETALGKKAKIQLMPLQPGDVPNTFADVSNLIDAINYKPQTEVSQGVSRFVDWYKEYYNCS